MKIINLPYAFRCLLFTAPVCVGHIFAQNLKDTSKLDPVVVTGERPNTKISQSLQNIRIINREMIERQGAITLKDLLSKELNIRITNDNILGSGMSLMGVSGQNIKILFDGVPIVGRENGNIDLNQINLSNVERIEIIEGPLSVVYGTDALGGVINIITKNDEVESFRTTASGYTESIGVYNWGVGVTSKIKAIRLSASFNRNFFDGYNPIPGQRVMLWKPKMQYFGDYSVGSSIGNFKWKFQSNYFFEKIENRQKPIITSEEAYAFDEYYITNRLINSLVMDFSLSKKYKVNLLNSYSTYQRDKITYLKNLETLEKEPVKNPLENSSNQFFSLVFRGTISSIKKQKINFLAGYDFNFNYGKGNRIDNTSGSINDLAIFGTAEYKINNRFIVKPGLRLAYNSTFKAPFIPSLSAKYDFSRRFSARASYGRGFRAPGLKELYLNFVDYNHNIKGNENLRAEKSDNYYLSMRYRVQTKKYVFVIDNGFFYNKINDMIGLVSVNLDSLFYTYQNFQYFKSKGMSVNATYTTMRMALGAGISYTGINNTAFQSIGRKAYAYSPELRLMASYTLKKNDVTMSLFYKGNGKQVGYMFAETQDVIQTYTNPFHILDFTVSGVLWKERTRLSAGVKNIFNVTSVRSVNPINNAHGGISNQMNVSIGRSLFVQATFTIKGKNENSI